jgi:hypothetical protein
MNAFVRPPGVTSRSEIYHLIISEVLHKNEEISRVLQPSQQLEIQGA